MEKELVGQKRFKERCRAQGLPADAGRSSIRVLKSRRVLELTIEGRLIKAYPIIVGRNSRGHKQAEGDERTPEGEYYLCTRNAASRFHLFLGFSYPNGEDARKAREAGIISEEKCREICEAIEKKQCPDWYTPLGGEVGLHGGGIDREGTAGCIALRNADIEELWAATCLGTPVEIHP